MVDQRNITIKVYAEKASNESFSVRSVSYGNIQSAFNSSLSAVRKTVKRVQGMCMV